MANDEDKIAELLDEESYNASDAVQVDKAVQKAKRRTNKYKRVAKAIMDEPDGREFMYALLIECESFRISYMAGQPYEATTFRDGKKYIGYQLMAHLRRASTVNYNLMLDECEKKKLAPLFPTDGF